MPLQSNKMIFRAIFGASLLLFVGSSFPSGYAAEVPIFSNETEEFNANRGILDNDNTGGDVILQFGRTLNERLYWDDGGSKFIFTDDLNVQGNLDVDGVIFAGSGNIAITDAAGNLDGAALAPDSVDDAAIDFGNGAGQINATDIPLTDTFDNSDGEEVQSVLGDLDAAITATSGPETKSLVIPMNSLTIVADGSNNSANIYADVETGVNPHTFYVVKSEQATLQDLNVVFKVRVPEDFGNFSAAANDVSFFYKNTGTNNTDSKIDILIEDKDGDDAFLAAEGQTLFNTSWTNYTNEFDEASFNPVAGEYIYVTFKGYGSYDAGYQSPYLGELFLTYTTS